MTEGTRSRARNGGGCAAMPSPINGGGGASDEAAGHTP